MIMAQSWGCVSNYYNTHPHTNRKGRMTVLNFRGGDLHEDEEERQERSERTRQEVNSHPFFFQPDAASHQEEADFRELPVAILNPRLIQH